MSNVMGYVSYTLLNLDGVGHQPYNTLAQIGMGFEGGLFGRGGRMLGYLVGESAKVDLALTVLSPWLVDRMTSAEALLWSEESLPINSRTPEGPGLQSKYVGPAELDAGGRIVRPLADTPWS